VRGGWAMGAAERMWVFAAFKSSIDPSDPDPRSGGRGRLGDLNRLAARFDAFMCTSDGWWASAASDSRPTFLSLLFLPLPLPLPLCLYPVLRCLCALCDILEICDATIQTTHIARLGPPVPRTQTNVCCLPLTSRLDSARNTWSISVHSTHQCTHMTSHDMTATRTPAPNATPKSNQCVAGRGKPEVM